MVAAGAAPGELEHIDLSNIIYHFDSQAHSILRAWRGQCLETLKLLLLLMFAPSADTLVRIE